jgi:putative thioredoxin
VLFRSIDRNQQIAQQMGVQSVPSVFAFINGRPVDGFAGALPEQQIRAWLDPLLQKAGGPAAEQKAMIESALAQAAGFLAEKDLVTAHAVYVDVLDMDPSCAAAYAGLVRCALEGGDAAEAQKLLADAPAAIAKDKALDAVRAAVDLAQQAGNAGPVAELEGKVAASPDDHQARLDLAIALFAAGKREEAVEHLLTIVARARTWNEDAARKQLVKFFEAMGNADPLTVAARRRLSSLLFS